MKRTLWLAIPVLTLAFMSVPRIARADDGSKGGDDGGSKSGRSGSVPEPSWLLLAGAGAAPVLAHLRRKEWLKK